MACMAYLANEQIIIVIDQYKSSLDMYGPVRLFCYAANTKSWY